MHPLTLANQMLYAEEIYYVTRCSHPDCLDDFIPDPNGVDLYCFKQYDYTDL
jgi:hypothetical protein